jgi:hypothetical protein
VRRLPQYRLRAQYHRLPQRQQPPRSIPTTYPPQDQETNGATIMDQLKPYLAAMKEHSFWIMCGGILLVSIGSWYTSTSKLDAARQERQTAIEGSFTALDSLVSDDKPHPNDTSNAKMDGLISDLSHEIEKGWQKQYELQEKILVWPNTFPQEFHDAVNPLRPIESIGLNYSVDKDIRVGLRQLYRNYIELEFPKLADMIGAKWKAVSNQSNAADFSNPGGETDTASGTPMLLGPDGQPIAFDDSVVHWAVENQQELLLGHFGFTARPEPPTTLEVLYAQEDLWVLQALMHIIAQTNAGAEARHEAAIKDINFVRIGRTAMGLAGAVKPIGVPKAPGLNPNGEGQPQPAEGQPSPEGTPPEGTGSTDGVQPPIDGEGTAGTPLAVGGKADPAEGRYLGTNYRPLSAARLRSALTSADSNDAILAVAKRMPVRMRFRMDQRKLNVLLAECGNSRLPVEVRQVRINRDPAAVGTGSLTDYGVTGATGGSSGYEGAGEQRAAAPAAPAAGYSENRGGGEGGYGAAGTAGTGSITADATVDANLVDVEVYGIIYIYNPVNKRQLGLMEAAATAANVDPTLDALSGG